MEDINKAYATFAERDRIASLGGGATKIDIQHESGKMTARERIDMLLDKGTFVELDKLMVHRCTNYGMDGTRFRETASCRVTERSTDGKYLSMPMTSPFTAVRYRHRMPRR